MKTDAEFLAQLSHSQRRALFAPLMSVRCRRHRGLFMRCGLVKRTGSRWNRGKWRWTPAAIRMRGAQ